MKSSAPKKSGSASSATVATDPFVVTITIQAKQLTASGDLVTFSRGPVVWLIVNKDKTKYTVEIDYSKITHTSNNKKHEHPFPKDDKLSIVVQALQTAALVATIQDYEPKDTDSYGLPRGPVVQGRRDLHTRP